MYFEIDRAGVDDVGWIWRIRSDGDNALLASSDLLKNRAACIDAINLVRADAGGKNYVWDQTRDGGVDWVKIRPA